MSTARFRFHRSLLLGPSAFALALVACSTTQDGAGSPPGAGTTTTTTVQAVVADGNGVVDRTVVPVAEPAPVAQAGAASAPPPSMALDNVTVTGARIAMAKAARAHVGIMSPGGEFVSRPVPGLPQEQVLVPDGSRENYETSPANPVIRTAEQPVSTFSVDVDTGSYANTRRLLQQGRLPPPAAVRTEEIVNYFRYADAAPASPLPQPFALTAEIGPTPWNARTRLLRLGIQGWHPVGPRPPSNLVFLVDVSGSMNETDKLPLVKAALKLLVPTLGPADRISLVTYAGTTAVVLPATPGSEHETIAAAIDSLGAGGGTNGAAGLDLAYREARKNAGPGINTRVLLATDGDFNVGVTSFDELLRRVERERRTGVALTTLGFGQGNYNDHLMERLADAGDGNHAYIDTLAEGSRVLVENRDATLFTLARDVKAQVEFNPAVVTEYRLIGYENRLLKREDFNNDAVDAGEIGAGHHVTALYEIALAGEGGEASDPLRYGRAAHVPEAATRELGYLKLRWKKPAEGEHAASRLIERPITPADLRSPEGVSDAFYLAAGAAAFAQKLKNDPRLAGFGWPGVAALARRGSPVDPARGGEFVTLVDLAAALDASAGAGPRHGDAS